MELKNYLYDSTVIAIQLSELQSLPMTHRHSLQAFQGYFNMNEKIL